MTKQEAEGIILKAPVGWEKYSIERGRFYRIVGESWYAFEEGSRVEWVEPLRSTRLSFKTPAEILAIYKGEYHG